MSNSTAKDVDADILEVAEKAYQLAKGNKCSERSCEAVRDYCIEYPDEADGIIEALEYPHLWSPDAIVCGEPVESYQSFEDYDPETGSLHFCTAADFLTGYGPKYWLEEDDDGEDQLFCRDTRHIDGGRIGVHEYVNGCDEEEDEDEEAPK